MNDFVKIIEEVAKELGDTTPVFKAEGSHSRVYSSDRYAYKITEKKVLEKSSRINNILSPLGHSEMLSHIPRTVLTKDLGDKSLVVEELKKGDHPRTIDPVLLDEILKVLYKVHEIEIGQVITDFEGDEVPASEYWNNQAEMGQKYADKILQSSTVTEADSKLIESCLDTLSTICEKAPTTPKLVLVYKDVYPPNILVDENGELTAIIDWDSAMSGPIELEYAVLLARYPEMMDPIIDKVDLNKDTFVCAGIVQGLRFWKSFTQDSKYVDQQRLALKRLLEMKRS